MTKKEANVTNVIKEMKSWKKAVPIKKIEDSFSEKALQELGKTNLRSISIFKGKAYLKDKEHVEALDVNDSFQGLTEIINQKQTLNVSVIANEFIKTLEEYIEETLENN